MTKSMPTDWDETASNNSDINDIGLAEGVTKVPAFNNIAREFMSQWATWLGDDTLASATTTDLGSVSARYVTITGTTTITGLGTIKAGTLKFVTFSGALTLTYNSTSLILPGKANITTAAGDTAVFASEGSGNWRCLAYSKANYLSNVTRGYIYGLTTSNNASDANNDIDIAAGECASDATTPVLLVLASSITKRLDAAWAVGTNQGGLDTGSKANSTWYYVWVIGRSDTGVVDVLLSASATSPTMPTNYDRKQLVSAVRTNSSGNIIAYKQYGDRFIWTTPIVDVASTTLGTTASTFSITVPNLPVTALLNGRAGISSAFAVVYISGPDQADATPSSNDYFTLGTDNISGGSNSYGQVDIDTSTQQIRARSTQANTIFYCSTRGWEFRRGKAA